MKQPAIERREAHSASGKLHGAVWTLGIVSLLMDFSSELIHGLLPIYLTTTLGVGALTLGWIEGVAEATAMIVKIFSGTISDALKKRKPICVLCRAGMKQSWWSRMKTSCARYRLRFSRTRVTGYSRRQTVKKACGCSQNSMG